MSVQELLQLKRAPLDSWSVREQLWLASAVVQCGAQNWVSVSRAMRPLQTATRRPADWYSQRSCAAQFGALLERVQNPRSVGRRHASPPSPSPAPSAPDAHVAVLQRLTRDRVAELHILMAEEARQHARLEEEVKELLSNNITDARIRAMAAGIEAEKLAEEKEAARNMQRLREREDRRALLEKAWRRPDPESPHSSPLLTSLLQSAAPINQIANADKTQAVNIMSPMKEKQMENISMNMEPVVVPSSSMNKVQYHELQQIEQIKSELQKIEQNLIEGTTSTVPEAFCTIPTLHPTTPAEMPSAKDPPGAETLKTPEKIDIDDIEIKAEDVYAFSDIDLDIPPVSSIHKSSIGRTLHSDKNLFNKRELSSNFSGMDDIVQPTEQENAINISLPSESLPETTEAPSASSESNATIPVTETNTNQSSPPQISEVATRNSVDDASKVDVENNLTKESENVQQITIKSEPRSKPNGEEEDSDGEMNQKVSDLKKDLEAKKYLDQIPDKTTDVEKENDMIVVKEEPPSIIQNQENKTESSNTGPKENANETKATEQQSDSHIETDDDTPIEVIKEDKPGKTKRDYSRKKADKDDRPSPPRELENITTKLEFSDEVGSDNSQESADKKLSSIKYRFKSELGGSRSESPATPIDSLPNSPAPATPPTNVSHNTSSSTTEQDKDYRIWKKSIFLGLNRLCTLKYASLFQRPITDDQAPGYSQAVKKPVDLSSIRRNIDLGIIKTTQDFQREVLLMLTNALMYNRTDHRVYSMSLETIQEAISELNVLLQAQAHAAAETPTLSRLTRPPRPASRSAGPPVKRKRGGTSNDTPTGKKRRPEDA